MPPPMHPPTLLGIPAKLRIKIYEHIFGGEELILRPGSPLHPHLTLLRASKKIYDEVRATITPSLRIRILAIVDLRSLPIPCEIKDAHICRAQEIVIRRFNFTFPPPETDFLSSAKSLQTLQIGYTVSTRSYHNVLNMYHAAINSRRADKFPPISSNDKVCDDRILKEMIRTCKLDTALDMNEGFRPGLLWLRHMIASKHRGFKLIGLVGASLMSSRGTDIVKLQLKFDFDTFEVVERKVWGIKETQDYDEDDEESNGAVPLLTVHDARLHILDEGTRTTIARETGSDPEQEGRQLIWVGDRSDLKMRTLELA